jgi:IclR family transcriptional regulator, pca regulon regulatory protein
VLVEMPIAIPIATRLAKQDFIEGAAKALAVLECFSAERQRLNATQTAERAKLTRAAARRHLLTLQHLGYLEGEAGFFWLAPRVLRLAGNYLSSARLPRAVQPTLNRLSQETGRAFSVAVLDATEVVIVARSGEHRNKSAVLPHGVHLGARLPAFATSTGRLLLSELALPERTASLSHQKLMPLTRHTIVTKKQLLSEIATAQKQGFYEACEEHELGVSALAVPLRDTGGAMIAAMNVVESRSVDLNPTAGQKPLQRVKRLSLESQYLDLLLEASAEVRSLL